MSLVALAAFSSSRTLRDAKSVAAAFTKQVEGFTACEDDDFVVALADGQNEVKGLDAPSSDYYVLNISNGEGYVIVSGDDRFRDVLGYSTTGSLSSETVPDGLEYLLSSLSAEMQAAKEYYDANGITEVDVRQNLLTSGYNSIEPLIKTHWQQNYPFNAQLPVSYSGTYSIFHGKPAIGCVALSMAQIMNYWKYPARGQGGTYKNKNYDNVSVNFSEQTYNWDNISSEYGAYYDDNGKYHTGLYTQSQANEIAKLCYHLGVATDMKWNVDNTGESGTYDDIIPKALAVYFGYNKYAKLRNRDVLGTEEFLKEILDDISEGRPVLMGAESIKGGGHAFILDGYDASRGMLHINWGWAGANNGYYALSALQPNASLGNFIYNQDVVLGVQPAEEDFGFGPSVYYLSGTVKSSAISKGSYLTLHVDTLFVSDFLFEGSIGIAVYDSNGEMKLSHINAVLNPGYLYIGNDIPSPVFPRSMTAGKYTMRMVMQDSDGTVYPIHSKYGNPESWTVTVSSSAPNGKVTVVADDPVSTGIENIEISSDDAMQPAAGDDAYYTLTGVRVTQPGKGIYIRNGKKYVFR